MNFYDEFIKYLIKKEIFYPEKKNARKYVVEINKNNFKIKKVNEPTKKLKEITEFIFKIERDSCFFIFSNVFDLIVQNKNNIERNDIVIMLNKESIIIPNKLKLENTSLTIEIYNFIINNIEKEDLKEFLMLNFDINLNNESFIRFLIEELSYIRKTFF